MYMKDPITSINPPDECNISVTDLSLFFAVIDFNNSFSDGRTSLANCVLNLVLLVL